MSGVNVREVDVLAHGSPAVELHSARFEDAPEWEGYDLRWPSRKGRPPGKGGCAEDKRRSEKHCAEIVGDGERLKHECGLLAATCDVRRRKRAG